MHPRTVTVAGERLARWVEGAVLVGPVARDEVDCVLASTAFEPLGAASPDGRWLAWAGPEGVAVADLDACKMVSPPAPSAWPPTPPRRQGRR
ncbi:MAG: hypothetical protein R3F59_38465 [Myxococcota bacterium]